MADNQNSNQISSEQLARMSDAELVESMRLVGTRLAENVGGSIRNRLYQAAADISDELDRRTPNSGAAVAEEIVTSAEQLPPAATVEANTNVSAAPSAGTGLIMNAGAGAALGYVAALLMKKAPAKWVGLGAIAGAILKPVRRV